MLLVCPKSAVEFTSSGFNQYRITCEHPLFSASYTVLEEIFKDWKHGRLSESERRVLFLSLLDSTGKVQWNCAGEPTDRTVQDNMNYLISTTSWIHAVGNRVHLPIFSVNSKTRTFENIRVLLSEWNNCERETTKSSYALSLRVEIEKSRKRIEELIGEHKKGSDLYLRHLCKWFLLATNVPKHLWEPWTKIWMMEQPEIWGLEFKAKGGIDELMFHIEQALKETGHPNIVACYQHMRPKWTLVEKGLLEWITAGRPPYTILSEEDEELFDLQADKGQGQGQGQGQYPGGAVIEQASIDKIVASAPTEEPVRKNYTTQIAFMLERSKWNLKNRLVEQQNEQKQNDSGNGVNHHE